MSQSDIRKPAQGWNTWNVRSVLSHVHLPDAFSISLGIKNYSRGCCLTEALVGRSGRLDEVVIPGPHAYDGTFTSLDVTWHDVEVRVETAVDGDDWFAVATLLNKPIKNPSLCISAGALWNRPGSVRRKDDRLIIESSEKTMTICATGKMRNDEPVVEMIGPYLLVELSDHICVVSNPDRIDECKAIVDQKRDAFVSDRSDMSDVHNAMQICLAWDTIYDPFKDRVISPVSRIWSCGAGGWVLFDWDTYFAALMAAVENKELAYANAIAITEEATESGFIPNMVHPSGMKTRDRSQPPVGAITVKALCEMFGENVLAEQLFDALLTWNRWWPENRDEDGYLCWGSNPFVPQNGSHFETYAVNVHQGGAFESGLDNSPMYDDIPFDSEKHLLMLADVGLMSLYIADCQALVDLAQRIGRESVVDELQTREALYAEKLKSLWSEDVGMFLNKNLVTGELSERLSPTHFYPLIAGVATQEQAQRMMDDHFFNPEEFWGEWILPSIARNDPGYPDQRYWRGRIWAPMNFLVYLGMRNYDLPKARKALVEKSEALLLKEWNEHGHVHENYNADTGEGCDIGSSDAFYHWGGLLGLISVMENS